MWTPSPRSSARVRRLPFVVALHGLLVASAFLPSSAAAYCRTRTCEFRPDLSCEVDRETGCSTVGAFVYWDTHCIPFAVQRDGSEDEDITAPELAQLVNNGFDTWSSSSCSGGGSPELASGSQGSIACDGVEYNCNVREDNSNIVMFRDDFSNTSAGLRFGVIALTTLTANLVTGELFDADIEINSRDEDFEVGDVGGVGVNPNQPRDLRGVVNHELGHLLGLSHSEVQGALMRAAYEGSFQPGEDDVAGICAALGASNSDPRCTVPQLAESTECLGPDTACSRQSSTSTDSGGCACGLAAPRDGGSTGAQAVVALLGLSLAVRRARQSASRRPPAV
jgi:matrixin